MSHEFASNDDSNIFNVFEPLVNFPPRTKLHQKKEVCSKDSQESGILLRDAVNTALNNLSLDNKARSKKTLHTYDDIKSKQEVLVGHPINVIFPLGWAKQNVTVNIDRRRRGVGVNHINLIQIMGRTAHSWQPYVMHDSFNPSSIVR